MPHWLAPAALVLAAVIQAIAAGVIAYLTYRLIGVTSRYANATDAALNLSREQFDREWQPDLRIASISTMGVPAETTLFVVNLARPAALVTGLQIGTGGSSQQDIETYRLEGLIRGADVEEVKIQNQLALYRQKYSPIPPPVDRQPWQSSMGISFEYVCAGRKEQTPWFNCAVWFEGHKVTKTEPI